MKRVFVAIKISKQLQAEIAKWRQDFPDWPVRWVPDENLHITLAPPWPEDDIPKIKNNLAKIQDRFKPFKINFNKVSFGPNQRDPRLIWATGQAPEEIINLAKTVQEVIGQAQNNSRPFTLHLTLARFKPWQFSGFKNKNLDEQVSWPDLVNEVELIESVLLPTGAEYIALKKIKLTD